MRALHTEITEIINWVLTIKLTELPEENRKLIVRTILSNFKNITDIPYDYVASYVYQIDKIDFKKEDNEILNKNIEYLLEICNEDSKLSLEKILLDIRNNYRLAKTQRQFIELNYARVTDNLKVIERTHKEKIKILKNELDEATKAVKKYKSKYDKLMTDFMSIIGIFSAIIFAFFGGLTQLGSLGEKLSETPIHKILMYSSLSAILLITIIFISFNAISKMTNLNIRSCCSEKDCSHPFYKRNPILLFSLLFFIYLFIFSIVLRLRREENFFINILNSSKIEGLFFLVTIVVLLIIFSLYVIYKIIEYSKYKQVNKNAVGTVNIDGTEYKIIRNDFFDII